MGVFVNLVRDSIHLVFHLSTCTHSLPPEQCQAIHILRITLSSSYWIGPALSKIRFGGGISRWWEIECFSVLDCPWSKGRRSGSSDDKSLASCKSAESRTQDREAIYNKSCPHAQRSARIGLWLWGGQYSAPISGATHGGVPTNPLIWVSGESTKTETSKSIMTRRGRSAVQETRRLLGFKSRCATPFACKKATARVSWCIRSRATEDDVKPQQSRGDAMGPGKGNDGSDV